MTTDRCPGCGAAVTPGAPWCTLCYTDLRPREPEPQPVSAPAPAPMPVSVGAAVGAAPAAVPAAGVASPLPPGPALDVPVVVAPPVAGREVTFWPCAACGSRVPMADDYCSKCGASFLPSDPKPSLNLPGVGNVAGLDKPQRLALILGGVAAVMAAFVVLAFVLGSIL